jgi:Fic family protein
MPPLDDADGRVLTELTEFRTELRHQLAEPRRWSGQLRRSLTAGAIRGSNTIEGYTIGESDAEALVAGEEMPTRHDEQTISAVEGYRDALTYVQQAAHFEIFEYDAGLLSALHFMMTRNDLAKWPGRYRLGGVWVTGGPGNPPVYTGPGADDVPPLMAELTAWLNEGDLDAPLFARAAMAHLNLVSIHPWRDGNGRMSRCLHTLVLARDQVLAPEFSSIDEWLGLSVHNTGRYYDILQRTRTAYNPNCDTLPWIRFCLRAHHLQAQIVSRRLEVAAAQWSRCADLAAQRGLPERTVSALYAAATSHLRRVTYEHDEALTRDQAIRDLRDLRRGDLIEAVGQGRLQRYVAGIALRSLVAESRTSILDQPLREPYPA